MALSVRFSILVQPMQILEGALYEAGTGDHIWHVLDPVDGALCHLSNIRVSNDLVRDALAQDAHQEEPSL